jgi:hypothetical protein
MKLELRAIHKSPQMGVHNHRWQHNRLHHNSHFVERRKAAGPGMVSGNRSSLGQLLSDHRRRFGGQGALLPPPL